MNELDYEYVGFWRRAGATLIDTLLLLCITIPLTVTFYGWSYFSAESPYKFIAGPADLFISWILPALLTIEFWRRRQGTPGKMAIGARIVDARTGEAPNGGQIVGRYFAYYLSTVALGLGFVWIAFDARKQGWHDKLAGTVVIRPKNHGTTPVRFDPPTPTR